MGSKQGVHFKSCPLQKGVHFRENFLEMWPNLEAKQILEAETFQLPLTWAAHWFRGYLDFQLKQGK